MRHIPVMLDETLEKMAIRPSGKYIDATLGGGSHAAAILERTGVGGRLLGIDRDPVALERAGARLEDFGASVVTVQGNHADLAELATTHGFSEVDGVLIDTGVSSFQLDEAERGFSFMRDGPLDMRMDRTRGESAAELLARLDEQELAGILRELGEERQARDIARAIVKRREREPLETTGQLAALVESAVGGRRGRGQHPATRTFQAIRMAVNMELESLRSALAGAMECLGGEGRLVVITFESLSDRIVKRCFSEHVGREVSLYEGGSRWEGSLPRMEWVGRKMVRPGAAEVESNPRARSAKLRAVKIFREVGKNR